MTAQPKKSLAQQVAQFNRAYPRGTRVLYRSRPSAEPFASCTRSEAWALGDHTAVVMIEGKSGSVALDALVIFPNEPLSEDPTHAE